MAQHLPVMIAAVTIALVVMLLAAGAVSHFVEMNAEFEIAFETAPITFPPVAWRSWPMPPVLDRSKRDGC